MAKSASKGGTTSGSDGSILVDIQLRLDQLDNDLKEFERKVDDSSRRVKERGGRRGGREQGAFGGLGYASRYLVMAYKLSVAFGIAKEAARGVAAAVELVRGNTAEAEAHVIAMASAIEEMPGGIGTMAREFGKFIDLTAGLFGYETRTVRMERISEAFKNQTKAINDQNKASAETTALYTRQRRLLRAINREFMIGKAGTELNKSLAKEAHRYEDQLRKLAKLQDDINRSGTVIPEVQRRMDQARERIAQVYNLRISKLTQNAEEKRQKEMEKANNKKIREEQRYAEHISIISERLNRARGDTLRQGLQFDLAAIEERNKRQARYGTEREAAMLRELTILEKVRLIQRWRQTQGDTATDLAGVAARGVNVEAQARFQERQQDIQRVEVEGQEALMQDLKQIKSAVEGTLTVTSTNQTLAIAG